MENNVAQQSATPEISEKEKILEAIVALSESIIESYKAIRVVGVIVVVATFLYVFAVMAEFHGPIIFPVLVFVVVGNQVYAARTRNKEKKLVAMKNAYESKFGVVAT